MAVPLRDASGESGSESGVVRASKYGVALAGGDGEESRKRGVFETVVKSGRCGRSSSSSESTSLSTMIAF